MPDVSTEVAIATTTLSSAASTITFSTISGSYTDLRIVLTGKAVSGGVIYPAARFNSDTGTNYSNIFLVGSGSSASSARGSNENQIGYSWNGSDSTNPGVYTLDIFSYAASTNKTILATASEDANGSGAVVRSVHLYRSASAITSIELRTTGNNYAIGTTATLYGIL
jgi:hypothetical protein